MPDTLYSPADMVPARELRAGSVFFSGRYKHFYKVVTITGASCGRVEIYACAVSCIIAGEMCTFFLHKRDMVMLYQATDVPDGSFIV